jgi:hypothetical protein
MNADRYSTLPDLGQRLDFLLTIQLPILDLYRLRISSFLDGFESVSTSFVRAVPGAISRDPSRSGGENSVKRETTGVGGAQKLCKALVSTKYIAKTMQGWGDEVVSSTLGLLRIQFSDLGASLPAVFLRVVAGHHHELRCYGESGRRQIDANPSTTRTRHRIQWRFDL